MIAAVLNVIAAVFTWVYTTSKEFRQELSDQLVAQNIDTKGQDLVGMGVTATAITLVVVTILTVVVYILIAFFINKGAGWARITGLVLAIISLYELAGLMMPGGIFSVLQILAGLTAIVLCFIKPGAQFFIDTKNFKLANKQR